MENDTTRDESARSGFTLVELMVALFVSSIVIWGIYAIFVGGQRIFHEEQRISQAQLSLRLGMEVVKNDLKRAGYLMSPNVFVDPFVCCNQGYNVMQLHPIIHTNGTEGLVYNSEGNPVSIYRPDLNTGIAPDSIILAGNYISTMIYLAERIQASAGRVRLQNIASRPLPGFSPDGGVDSNAEPEFRRMFPTTGFLRVVNKYGRMMFSRIQSVDFTNRTITVNPGFYDASSSGIQCGIEGYGEGSEVNVVNAILYRIEAHDSSGKKTDLVRWQVDSDLNTIPGTREVIVEYAVDFQVWFREDNPVGAFPNKPNIDYSVDVPSDDDVVIGDPGALLDGSRNARPERLRAAIVKISVRSASEDVTFPFIRRRPGEPLVRFELEPSAVGSAHVRTLTAQVELPNIAFRNLRDEPVRAECLSGG